MTILTTGSNLEELLESKPTARGQVLSRFMGLEFLKKKEEVAKEIYSEFSKQKLSNVYSSEQLKDEILNHQTSIQTLTTQIEDNTKELSNVEEAITKGKRIGLLVTFAGTIPSMIPEFPPGITVVPKLAEGALAALDAGDVAMHDRLAAEAARDLADCDAIALGQFSLARAKSLVEQATGKPVLTTPDSAVLKLKRLLGG